MDGKRDAGKHYHNLDLKFLIDNYKRWDLFFDKLKIKFLCTKISGLEKIWKFELKEWEI